MELWDAYDSDFKLIEGKTLVRGENIPDGQYHLVCEVLVKHSDSTYLLMQRDVHKSHGGMWEATAGGSALRGETPVECAIRELREETGIYEQNLLEVGRVIHHQHHTIYVDYIVVTNCDKANITLQKGETQDYIWMDANAIKKLESDKLITHRMQVFVPELRAFN